VDCLWDGNTFLIIPSQAATEHTQLPRFVGSLVILVRNQNAAESKQFQRFYTSDLFALAVSFCFYQRKSVCDDDETVEAFSNVLFFPIQPQAFSLFITGPWKTGAAHVDAIEVSLLTQCNGFISQTSSSRFQWLISITDGTVHSSRTYASPENQLHFINLNPREPYWRTAVGSDSSTRQGWYSDIESREERRHSAKFTVLLLRKSLSRGTTDCIWKVFNSGTRSFQS